MIKKQESELVRYLAAGGATTCCNFVVYLFCTRWILLGVTYSTILAWILSVFVAFLLNKWLVFYHPFRSWRQTVKELLQFFLCRLFSGAFEVGMMWLFVEQLQMNDIIIKIAAMIVVVIVNYVASKWLIFKRS
ncbi:MAG: GtrA family protein [Lachnospiraceae bacterium]